MTVLARTSSHAPQSWFVLYIPKCQYDPVISYPGDFTETLTSKPSYCLLRSTRDQLALETVAASRKTISMANGDVAPCST
jgi:hypothetical protein